MLLVRKEDVKKTSRLVKFDKILVEERPQQKVAKLMHVKLPKILQNRVLLKRNIACKKEAYLINIRTIMSNNCQLIRLNLTMLV